MSNEEVIKAFLRGEKAKTKTRVYPEWDMYLVKGCTLESTGDKLINYSTVIAEWRNGVVYINTNRYSSTTTRIQGTLKRLAGEYEVMV